MANQMNVKQVFYSVTGQELCKSRGGRPGLPAPNSPYCLCGRKATLILNFYSLAYVAELEVFLKYFR